MTGESEHSASERLGHIAHIAVHVEHATHKFEKACAMAGISASPGLYSVRDYLIQGTVSITEAIVKTLPLTLSAASVAFAARRAWFGGQAGPLVMMGCINLILSAVIVSLFGYGVSLSAIVNVFKQHDVAHQLIPFDILGLFLASLGGWFFCVSLAVGGCCGWLLAHAMNKQAI